MSVEKAKEATEMNANVDEEQSAGEPTEEIAKIKEQEDEKVEQNEDEEGIRVPNWLIEALEWITRMEMKESKLSTSCLAFKRLCWPKLHGKVEPHFVESLYLGKERDEAGNFRGIVRRGFPGPMLPMPIPQVPPPAYILGFKNIRINFLDQSLEEFIKLLAPKFKDIELQLYRRIKAEDEQAKAIGCLLDIFGNKIHKLCIAFQSNIEHFNRLFPGIIDQMKEMAFCTDQLVRDVDFDILMEWLMRGRQNDGEQKILNIGRSEEVGNIVERIKKAFLTDTVRRNFLVNFKLDEPFDEFAEENEKTGEILRFYANLELDVDDGLTTHLLIRCPKDEEDRWKKEGEKKLKGNANDGMTIVTVDFKEQRVIRMFSPNN